MNTTTFTTIWTRRLSGRNFVLVGPAYLPHVQLNRGPTYWSVNVGSRLAHLPAETHIADVKAAALAGLAAVLEEQRSWVQSHIG